MISLRIRASVFGMVVEIQDDASEQRRLIAFPGRNP
jgi:hypothetical protein